MSGHSAKLTVIRPGCRIRKQQGGFSLIELMVSIRLGLLIITVVLALYLDLSRSNAELAKMNRQITADPAVIAQELWRAGFWDICLQAINYPPPYGPQSISNSPAGMRPTSPICFDSSPLCSRAFTTGVRYCDQSTAKL